MLGLRDHRVKFDSETDSTVYLSCERRKSVSNPCLLSIGDIGVLVFHCLFANTDLHQWGSITIITNVHSIVVRYVPGFSSAIYIKNTVDC